MITETHGVHKSLIHLGLDIPSRPPPPSATDLSREATEGLVGVSPAVVAVLLLADVERPVEGDVRAGRREAVLLQQLAVDVDPVGRGIFGISVLSSFLCLSVPLPFLPSRSFVLSPSLNSLPLLFFFS